MEALLNFQLDLFTRIDKAKVNFKKSPKDRITKEYLEDKLELLEQLWFEFSAGHKELMRSEFNKEQLAETNYVKKDVHSQTEEIYFEYKLLIKSLLNKFVVVSSEPKASTSASISLQHQSADVKLPKVNIPVFTGKYSEWNTFRDLFQSLIHSNRNLGNAQKLLYLKGYLQGEAEQLLCNIPITDSNYERCWSLLDERYNNKRYICHNILKRLLSQRNISCESASGLKGLMDTTNDCLSALANIGIDTGSWDVLVIHIITLKLDPESRRQWEFSVMDNKSNDLPTYQQFEEFIKKRYRAIEFLDSGSKSMPTKNINVKLPINRLKTMHITTLNCPFCKEEHKLSNCKGFKDSSVESRREFVASNNICYCCLGNNHSAKFCHSNYKCRICRRKHNVLLHPTNTVATQEPQNREVKADNHEEVENTVVSCTATRNNVNYSQVLLATALVHTVSKCGQTYTLRALLDQGSQSSFITEAMVQLLGLKKVPVKGQIIGVGGANGLVSKAMVEIKISSRTDPNFIIVVKAYVLGSITSLLPTHKITAKEWKEFDDIVLADPSYYTSNSIDLLLGSEVYSQIIQNGVMKGPHGSPLAQCTSFGWILSGVVYTSRKPEKIKVMHCSVEENQILKKFWELEDDIPLPKERMYTEDENACEEYFAKTTRRDENGRYVVRLPLKDKEPDVQNSLQIAERRLYSLERRLKNRDLKQKYTEVINEYIESDHMEQVPADEIHNPKAIYLPHHVVIRDDKDTTKVRVVFDASCTGSNNKSLNDCLLVGPTLQPELRHIVMRWRNHPICLSADIVKMFRQVKVNENDIDFQRILWRDDASAEIIIYRLLRVTFGEASSPYLAVKALQQLAFDHGEEFPRAAEKILSDFYMDDLMTGCETVEQGIQLYREMNKILAKGGFELQKWTTNNEYLLEEMKEDSKNSEQERENEGLKIKTDEIMKIVGITWDRREDVFRYKVDVSSFEEPVTKRKIISDISRFYDPLGWAGPSIIIAKIIIQKLWLAGIDWDEIVPNALLNEWLIYRQELVHLQRIYIPRWTGVRTGNLVELHGFCDASKEAYAAVVYCRVVNSEDNITVTLISAKSKVAPVKQVSIPRLELCGAVLLCRLLIEVASVMKIEKAHLHAWTDSTVVLAWLNSSPKRWKVFVANRVSEIITNLDSHHWSHVSTKCNPADVASRGLRPSDLVENNMWFQGPQLLREKNIEYKRPKDMETDLEIVKVKSCCATTTLETFKWERFSTLIRLIRVIAYCKRFINNSRKGTVEKRDGYLKAIEIQDAMRCCIVACQSENFGSEIEMLKKGDNLPKRSSLQSLRPFLDGNNVLRVGGRLENSQLDERRKHPILIPRKSYLTNLLILDAHLRTLHGGPQLMMCYLQSKYWILGLKQIVKSVFKKCVTCAKNTGNIQTQLMGQLPAARVTPTRPFKSCGVDYAGPIQLRTAKGRGHKSHKGYICVFVCMVTRAIHLDVVSDLTSEGFLQVFKRFVGRRGLCTDIWSDNATNFVGAASELKKLFTLERNSMIQEIVETVANQGCTWHFIPSRSPNFGGLWESGVKSVKYHLKRVIGNSTLTFEEMTTVLVQIEACLNSRPLSTITCNDDDGFNVLTPGHFLIGEALVVPPERSYESSNISSLRRWQYTQKMLQDFWRQWSRQYLQRFYQRYRWSSQNPQPKVGDVVVVKEDNLSAGQWLYGRVVEIHPGNDNIVRVVSLKVKNGIVKRPISKVCLLPIAD